MKGRLKSYNRYLESLQFLTNINPDLPNEVKNMIVEYSSKLVLKYHINEDDMFLEDYIGRIGVLYYQYRDDAIIDWAKMYIAEYFMIVDGTHGEGTTFSNDAVIAREICDDLRRYISSARK